jgi:hypothetical protein
MEPAIAPEMIAVIPRPAHTVRVVFIDGEVRDVDITPLLDTPAFSPLRDRAAFERVQVDEETGTLFWPGDIDLDPDVIYAGHNLGPGKARIYILAPSVATASDREARMPRADRAPLSAPRHADDHKPLPRPLTGPDAI